jgi:hypothetical protein
MPDTGVVLAHTGNLPPDFRGPAGVFLVGVVADGMPHEACHFHIFQNAAHAQRLPRSAFMPHWPQPGLIARNLERGDRFQTLAYFGNPGNLATELRDPAFPAAIRDKFGLEFRISERDRWHDYSETDIVLAIRAFESRPFLRKPSSKLYNAWLAGVPFIGGSDSAFSSDGLSGVNYLRCTTPHELDSTLCMLHEDIGLRHRLVTAGREAMKRFTSENILCLWSSLLDGEIACAAENYFARRPEVQLLYRMAQRLFVRFDRISRLD